MGDNNVNFNSDQISESRRIGKFETKEGSKDTTQLSSIFRAVSVSLSNQIFLMKPNSTEQISKNSHYIANPCFNKNLISQGNNNSEEAYELNGTIPPTNLTILEMQSIFIYLMFLQLKRIEGNHPFQNYLTCIYLYKKIYDKQNLKGNDKAELFYFIIRSFILVFYAIEYVGIEVLPTQSASIKEWSVFNPDSDLKEDLIISKNKFSNVNELMKEKNFLESKFNNIKNKNSFLNMLITIGNFQLNLFSVLLSRDFQSNKNIYSLADDFSNLVKTLKINQYNIFIDDTFLIKYGFYSTMNNNRLSDLKTPLLFHHQFEINDFFKKYEFFIHEILTIVNNIQNLSEKYSKTLMRPSIEFELINDLAIWNFHHTKCPSFPRLFIFRCIFNTFDLVNIDKNCYIFNVQYSNVFNNEITGCFSDSKKPRQRTKNEKNYLDVPQEKFLALLKKFMLATYRILIFKPFKIGTTLFETIIPQWMQNIQQIRNYKSANSSQKECLFDYPKVKKKAYVLNYYFIMLSLYFSSYCDVLNNNLDFLFLFITRGAYLETKMNNFIKKNYSFLKQNNIFYCKIFIEISKNADSKDVIVQEMKHRFNVFLQKFMLVKSGTEDYMLAFNDNFTKYLEEITPSSKNKHPDTTYQSGIRHQNFRNLLELSSTVRSPTQMTCALYGICFAMNSIHSKDKVYGNLTPENLPLNKDNEIDIEAIIEYADNDNPSNPESLYSAPELISKDPNAQIDNKIDIYAFGLIIYEIFHQLKDSNGQIAVRFEGDSKPPNDDSVFLQRVKKGKKIKKEPDIPEQIWTIITSCWETDPTKRPTFQDLLYLFIDPKYWLQGTDAEIFLKYVLENNSIDPKKLAQSYIVSALDDDFKMLC